MVDKICLDTDFLINFSRGKKEEVDFVLSHENKATLATTYINLFELYVGAYKSQHKDKNLEPVHNILRGINLLNLTEESTRLAAEILAKLEKQGEVIDYKDLLVGCIAMAEGFSLKTNNKKHFNRIDGLKVV